MPEMPDYNPNSVNAQFSAIHTTLGSQNVILIQILEETRKTNGRVTELERQLEGRWKYVSGAVAAITLFGAGVYALLHFLMGKSL